MLEGNGANGHRHPVAWMLWALSASASILLTRNPWYTLVVGAGALGVMWRLERRPPARGVFQLYLGMLLFPTMLNLVFSRSGATVLLEFQVPLIGGPYTLEALLFGLSSGVQIASVLVVMLLFSQVVTAPDLLRRLPAGLYPAGVTASLGLTFFPQARRSFGELREAQAVRGYQWRGWRDLPQLVTPLVILSLESALALAEGLTVRGWSGRSMTGGRRMALSLGWLLLACAIGVWALAPGRLWLAELLLAAGLLATWQGLRQPGPATRFRPDIWRTKDSLMVGLALASLVVMVLLGFAAPRLLGYYPYPRAIAPGLRWPIALALCLLGSPIVLADD
jgi:energy-coupling factor transport system permease protein